MYLHEKVVVFSYGIPIFEEIIFNMQKNDVISIDLQKWMVSTSVPLKYLLNVPKYSTTSSNG